MNSYVDLLLQRHRRNGILLDANLLLLLFIGSFRPELIGVHKRLNVFRVKDYELLIALTRQVRRIFTTPNILTQVSDLSTGPLGLSGELARDYFGLFASQLSVLHELYITSVDAAADPGFHKFGLTDSVIAVLARTSTLVLTIDLPLSSFLQNRGFDALNFTNLRDWQ